MLLKLLQYLESNNHISLPTMLQAIWHSKINIPRRLYWLIARIVVRRFGLYSVSAQSQNDLFKSNGLDRQASIQKLNEVLSDCLSTSYHESYGMFSEHLLLLSAISITKHNITNILEIGTFDGKTALILSKLFPSSTVTTVDLPDDSTTFTNTYGRNKDIFDFVKNRNNLLAQIKKIAFKQVHSINLVRLDEKFDLIWIDGAHGYPVVAMDVINSFRLAHFGAYILIDDIWVRTRSDNNYESIGGYESCNALKDASLISSFTLFNKRLSGIYNYPGQEKFVALFRKNLQAQMW